jgi:hypothetical protein
MSNSDLEIEARYMEELQKEKEEREQAEYEYYASLYEHEHSPSAAVNCEENDVSSDK